ncbi:MAG: hypothetical protein ACYST9_06365 [Planctomycetota bacterium]|jgi:hypothetical protein
MTRKLAVVIRSEQSEALRMSIGLILMDDIVDIVVLNNKLERSEETALNIETVHEMDMKIYSNVEQEDDVTFIPTPEMAEKLLTYDHVLAF